MAITTIGDQWSFATQVKMLEFDAVVKEVAPKCQINTEQYFATDIKEHMVCVTVTDSLGTRHSFTEEASQFPAETMTKIRLLVQ